MYDVTNTFINYAEKNGRQIDMNIYWNDVVFTAGDIFLFSKTFNGDLYKAVMQTIECEVEGKHDFTNAEVRVEFGIAFGGSDFEYIDYGYFIVKEHERIVGSHGSPDRTRFKAYDIMLNSHQEFDADLITLQFPITVYDLLDRIANFMNTTVWNDSIVNGDKIIPDDQWTGTENVTYRDVLDAIAEASGSSIIIRQGKLYSKNVLTGTTNLTNPNFQDFEVVKEVE